MLPELSCAEARAGATLVMWGKKDQRHGETVAGEMKRLWRVTTLKTTFFAPSWHWRDAKKTKGQNKYNSNRNRTPTTSEHSFWAC